MDANQMNHSKIVSHNYIGSLQELCVKLKVADSNRTFTDMGTTMTINNRSLFKMETKVIYETKVFIGSGEGFKKQEAKSISAKFCLIQFIAHLRANEHPQLRLEDYGLCEDDLQLSTDPKLYTPNDSGLNSLSSGISSSSSKGNGKQTVDKIKPVERGSSPTSTTNNPSKPNSLASIQAYVDNKATYKRDQNPFALLSNGKATMSTGGDRPDSSTSGPTSSSLYAKPPNSKQVPFSRTNDSSSETIDQEFDSSMSLNDEGCGRVLQLNDFKTTKSSRSDCLNETDQFESDELARTMSSPPNRPIRTDDTLTGYDYIVDNQAAIQCLFDDYDLAKGLSYFVLLSKLLEQLPELHTEFRQNKASSKRKISYQKIYYGDWNLATVFSEASAGQSAEDCSQKIFKSLLAFKMDEVMP